MGHLQRFTVLICYSQWSEAQASMELNPFHENNYHPDFFRKANNDNKFSLLF